MTAAIFETALHGIRGTAAAFGAAGCGSGSMKSSFGTTSAAPFMTKMRMTKNKKGDALFYYPYNMAINAINCACDTNPSIS